MCDLCWAESSPFDLSTRYLHRGPGQEHQQDLVFPGALDRARRVGTSHTAMLDQEGRARSGLTHGSTGGTRRWESTVLPALPFPAGLSFVTSYPAFRLSPSNLPWAKNSDF